VQLATLTRPDGSTSAAVLRDGGWSLLPCSDVGVLLSSGDWEQRAIEAPTEPAGAEWAPGTLVPNPSKILCCGLNYENHILEMGRDLPTAPTLFAKFADTLCGPTDDIVWYEPDEPVDWEAELAVVVGREIFRVTSSEAAAAIAGYTVANDVSLRGRQNRTTQWLQGKAADRTTPLGPVLVTGDEVDPARGLAIDCHVNGETVQSSTTSELVFDAAYLVWYVAQFTTLRPGDLILTGTPGGVGAGRTPQRF
jgi:acylpyruvate hydrolase